MGDRMRGAVGYITGTVKMTGVRPRPQPLHYNGTAAMAFSRDSYASSVSSLQESVDAAAAAAAAVLTI